MTDPVAGEIARYLAGDRSAADAIVRRVGRIALPLAVAVLRSREEAGDVTQDVALDVLRGLRRLRDPERFDAWVRRIAVRHTLAAARSRRRRAVLEQSLWPVRDHAVEAPLDADALALRDALRAALATLSPRQRIALALRYVHGLSEAEIAAALGCRPGTAASLLSRGRELLRAHVGLAEVVARPIEGGV